MSRISMKFESLKKQGKKGLIAYITAGDPDIHSTEKLIYALERGGADIIELGVPFSDPMADGPVIQRASERALKSGTSLRSVLEVVRNIRKKSDIPIVLFGYYNPFYSYGVGKFADDSAKAGVDGVLVVDLPIEEIDELKNETDKRGIDTIFLIAPTSTDARIKAAAERCRGFIYFVSLTGVTGARETVSKLVNENVRRIKKYTDIPVAVGFGISTPAHVKEVTLHADAAVVGSAIVKVMEDEKNSKMLAGKVEAFVRYLKN